MRRREDVEQRRAGDGVRLVEAQAVRHPGASVVPDHRVPPVPEFGHEGVLVGGHGAEGVARVVLPGRRPRGVAVAPEVRGDDGVGLGQGGGHAVPHHVRLGKAVQQEDRRPVAPDLGVHGHVAGAGVHRDVYRAEPVEHRTTVAAAALRHRRVRARHAAARCCLGRRAMADLSRIVGCRMSSARARKAYHNICGQAL